jgi:hypothetical protein
MREAERVRKRLYRMLMVLVVATAATITGVVLAPAASATTFSPVQYLLHPAYLTNSWCVDAATVGDGVAMNVCQLPAILPSQTIQITQSPLAGSVWLQPHVSGPPCLAVTGASFDAGATINQQDCGRAATTRWVISWSDHPATGHENGPSVQIRNIRSGLCMDGHDSSVGVVQNPCNLGTEWFLVPVGGNYRFQPQHSNKCLDIDNTGGGLQAGALAQQWSCGGPRNTNQLFSLELQMLPYWQLSPAGYMEVIDPMYKIHPQHSGACLANQHRYDNGFRVTQQDCASSGVWFLRPVLFTPDVQTFQVRTNQQHLAPDVCLDVDNAGASQGLQDGAKVQLWQCLGNGQTNQIWQLVGITA